MPLFMLTQAMDFSGHEKGRSKLRRPVYLLLLPGKLFFDQVSEQTISFIFRSCCEIKPFRINGRGGCRSE